MAASVAMIAIVTSSSINVNPARTLCAGRLPASLFPRTPLILNDTNDLLYRSEPCLHFRPAVGAKRLQSTARGNRAQIPTRRAGRDGITEVIGDDQELEHAEPSTKSSPATRGTSRSPHQ